MEREEAARVLRVRVDASSDAVRTAYRARIRAEHPDLAGPAATDDAARVNEAYAVLRQPAPTAPPPSRPSAPAWPAPVDEVEPEPAAWAPSDVVTLVDDDTVGFSFPADEVFPMLVAVADELGEITYLDADNGILEAIVAFQDEPVCSLVLSLQGRADRVEAFCTIEALDGSQAPPTNEVVSLLFRSLRARLRSR